MKTRLTVLLTLCVAAVAAWFAWTPTSADEPADAFACVPAAEVKWAEAKGHPAGVQSCLLHGDPKAGAFVLMLRIPAGTVYPPHTHSADEVVAVVSGMIVTGPGETRDDAKGHELAAGSYFTFKAGTPHWGVAKTDVVLARYGNGAADIKFCNPADAPAGK